MIGDINTLITCLICNVRTRNYFEINSRDEVKDVTYQLHSSWGIPSVTLNHVKKLKKRKGPIFFPCETWPLNYEWYWEMTIWSCADTLYFRIRTEKMFCLKILLILPKFHEKTLRRSGDIEIFRPGKRIYVYTLPHHSWTKS